MQSMVDKLRTDENDPSYDDQKTVEELIDMLMGMIASGQITVDQAKDMIRNAPDTVDEMSATGGGPGGATFTGGQGMQYAQALDQPKKKPKVADKECPGKWYGGVGIQTGFDMQRRLTTIERVFIGYPADLAGLQAGDIILSINDKEILGEPGTPISFLIERNGQVLTFSFNRGKVCY